MPCLLLTGGTNRSLWANRGDLIAELLAAGVDVHAALPPEEAVRRPPLHSILIHRIPGERTGMNPPNELAAAREGRAAFCLPQLPDDEGGDRRRRSAVQAHGHRVGERPQGHTEGATVSGHQRGRASPALECGRGQELAGLSSIGLPCLN